MPSSILSPITLKEFSKSHQLTWVKYRRAFHQIAELSWKEEKTLKKLMAFLHKIVPLTDSNFDLKMFKGGLCLDCQFNQKAPWLLFRCELDGLPIEEKTNLPFSSIHKGIMHACGHDFHIAMLLGAIHSIFLMPIKPQNNIRFVFQRAEETGTVHSGGKMLVDEGILNGINRVFGLHISSLLPPFEFYSNPGAFLASPRCIDLQIRTTGGHVMHPNQGTNAIDILTDILSKLKEIQNKIVTKDESIVIVPSILEAGTASNIRPQVGRLKLAIRTFLDQNNANQLTQNLKKEIENIVNYYPDSSIEKFIVEEGYPVLKNDPSSMKQVFDLLAPHYKVSKHPPLFAGEDFSYFLEKTKGCYIVLGAKNKEGQDHHTANFNPNEKVLHQGVSFWLLLAYHPQWNLEN
jgi:amidohydrolase